MEIKIEIIKALREELQNSPFSKEEYLIKFDEIFDKKINEACNEFCMYMNSIMKTKLNNILMNFLEEQNDIQSD